jgi:hypothetical protein
MKARLLVAPLIVVVFGVVVIAAWFHAGTHPQFVPPNGEVVVRGYDTGQRSFPAESARADEIVIWFNDHQAGWSTSFATYAPKTTISGDTFHINLLDDRIVLNYLRHRPSVWMQITRTLTPEEQAFWRNYASRTPEA